MSPDAEGIDETVCEKKTKKTTTLICAIVQCREVVNIEFNSDPIQ